MSCEEKVAKALTDRLKVKDSLINYLWSGISVAEAPYHKDERSVKMARQITKKPLEEFPDANKFEKAFDGNEDKPACHYCNKRGRDIKLRVYKKIHSRFCCNNCFMKHYAFFCS